MARQLTNLLEQRGKKLGNFLSELIHDFLILFGIVNIIGNIPHISALTNDISLQKKRKIFYFATFTSICLVSIFAVGGNFILLNVFDVTFSSFKVAGGIIVFLVSVRGVVLGPSKAVGFSENADFSQRFSTIVFPFLVGPGTLVTTILLMQASGRIQTLFVIMLVYSFVLLVLMLIPFIEKTVGKLIMLMTSRILYIFVAAKAVKFIISGIKECF